MTDKDDLRTSFQQNEILNQLDSDGVVIGAPVKLHSPSVIELFGDIGLDYGFIDFEHTGPSPWDSYHLESLLRAAEISDTELIVRIPSPDTALVRKVLDTGVRNIIIPRVKTKEEVIKVVRASRFIYDKNPGERGIGAARVNMWEDFNEDEDYIEREDNSVLVGIIIETKEAINHLDEILSIPEIGLVLVGHVDLALSYGYSQESDANIRYPHDIPEIKELSELVISKANKEDVPYGKVPKDIMDAKDALDEGYQLLLLQNEMDAIRQLYDKWLAALR